MKEEKELLNKMDNNDPVPIETPQPLTPINNKLKEIKSFRQLLRASIDIDSPKFKKACFCLGVKNWDAQVQ